MITDLPTKRKRYHSDKHLSEFCLQDGGQKSTGIDMKGLLRHCHPMYSQRKCADTTGTMPVSWAGHFQSGKI